MRRYIGYFFKIHTLKKVKLFLYLVTLAVLAFLLRRTQLTQLSYSKNRHVSEKLNASKMNLLSVTLPNVIVHIDLKGAPPKLSYLISLLDDLKRLGVNGLLIEYEDMFPYEGRLKKLRGYNCYQKEELTEFVTKAKTSGFEVIPLVQTFGHMEYVLQFEEYRNLSENSSDSRDICPSRRESLVFIEEMLKQIIEFHSSIIPLKHLHIGCDEVFMLNKCSLCRSRQLTDIGLYVRHVNAVTEVVQKLSHNTRVLFWDDMFRGMDIKQWANITLRTELEPVYWDYSSKLSLSHVSLYNYHKRFDNIWIASAFKGADGNTETLPNINNRFRNHFSWMTRILEYRFGGEERIFVFKGIILTGWSRYHHFAPPCELLPASIPSLMINLLLIQRFREGFPSKESHWLQFFEKYLRNDTKKLLRCDVKFKMYNFSKCSFEGRHLYNILYRMMEISKKLNKGKRFKEANISEHTLTVLMMMNQKLQLEMAKYYNRDVIEEYTIYKFNDIVLN